MWTGRNGGWVLRSYRDRPHLREGLRMSSAEPALRYRLQERVARSESCLGISGRLCVSRGCKALHSSKPGFEQQTNAQSGRPCPMHIVHAPFLGMGRSAPGHSAEQGARCCRRLLVAKTASWQVAPGVAPLRRCR